MQIKIDFLKKRTMSILNLPTDILWIILEKHLYDYTRKEWNQDIYKSLIGSQPNLMEKCTINETMRLKSVCKSFNTCIRKNMYTKNGFLYITKKQYLLH